MTALETLISDHAAVFAMLAGLSVLSMLAAFFGLPLLVLALPADYFKNPDQRMGKKPGFGPGRFFLILLKNTLGLILFLAGILMLLLPGQGLLTMLGGILLMDFPGKYKLERKLSRQKQVARTLAWIRRKGGKTPFQYKPD